MSPLLRALCLGLAAGAAAIGTASAQYYPPAGPPIYEPPPPGYAPPPEYPPPDRREYREWRREREARLRGDRCEALFRTPYGPQRVVCELYRSRRLGEPCSCPAPPPPPGYAPGPPGPGRVIP